MRRILLALHVVALAVWFGSLVFTFLLAGTLFGGLKPLCPACLKPTVVGEPPVVCVACGALHHSACSASGCGLEHEGSHVLSAPSEPASVSSSMSSSTGLARWERVKLNHDRATPERRLLWRLDAGSGATQPEKGETPGSCFEIPRSGVGDALARGFPLAQAVAVGMAIASLLTVLLTPPGGALRLLRLVALVAGVALAAVGLDMSRSIATQRLSRENVIAPTKEIQAAFDKTHGRSSAAAVAEAVLVLVALVLVLERREPANPAS